MSRKRKLCIIFLLAVTVTVLGFSVYVYIKQLNSAITKSNITTMKELSEHDMHNIEASLEISWKELKSVGDRINLYNKDTLENILQREQTASSFSRICLVDTEGFIYTAEGGVGDGKQYPFVRRLLEGDKRFVKRNEGQDAVPFCEETLIYAVSLDSVQIGDTKFIGALGFCNIGSIEELLKIDSFGGKGYTTVINTNGYYIVNTDENDAKGEKNFFKQLKQGEFSSGTNAQKIMQKIDNGEDFVASYINADNTEEMLSFMKIDYTSWYMIITVPVSVFKTQSRQFVVITTIMLFVVMIVIVTMLIVIIRSMMISAEAKAQAQAKEDFLSNMSHEIRTPLNGLIGLNHLMKQNIDKKDKLEECLEKSNAAAKYLLALINDILDMSKLSQGYMKIENKPFSLEHMLDVLESILNESIDIKHLKVIVDDAIEYPLIIGDEIRLEQVLMNILGNAVKFTPEGGKITLKITQNKEQDEYVTTRFEITDTGCGMSEEFLIHIFDIFTQEKNDFSQKPQGTGLGMSISYLLMKQMDGKLNVRSKLGEGSSFEVILTSKIVDEIKIEETENTVLSDKNILKLNETSNRLHILVAEDNELNAEIITEILELRGFAVDVAENGQVALEMFESSEINEYDLILMDAQMPVMTGFEAARKIRKSERQDAGTVKIFACTANTFNEDKEKAAESGMNGFIPKPIDINMLIQMLNEN